LLSLVAANTQAKEASLTPEGVREAFTSWVDESMDFTVTDPDAISIAEGSFTSPGADEAVVAFVDRSKAHMSLPGEIWLLRRDGGRWAPALMIDQSDEITFQTLDIAGSGIMQILLRAQSSITGGMRFMHWSLVSLAGGEARTLYAASGTGFWFRYEWVHAGGAEPLTDHEVVLKDTDGDGIVELVDTELSGAFVYTGAGEDGYELRNTPVKTTVYRFVIDDKKNIVSVEGVGK
jgi:hypothetical protein